MMKIILPKKVFSKINNIHIYILYWNKKESKIKYFSISLRFLFYY